MSLDSIYDVTDFENTLLYDAVFLGVSCVLKTDQEAQPLRLYMP